MERERGKTSEPKERVKISVDNCQLRFQTQLWVGHANCLNHSVSSTNLVGHHFVKAQSQHNATWCEPDTTIVAGTTGTPDK